MLNYIILALSVSIDSFGIGITYGLKHIKIDIFAKIILFFISFFITTLSIYLGNFISSFLSPIFAKILGSFILIFVGIKIINAPISADFDSSNIIDAKESLYLGLALSLDSFGIGIAGSFLGTNSIFYSLFVAIFQLLFLTLGTILGKKISIELNLSDRIWTIISGVLLIIIGFFKLGWRGRSLKSLFYLK